MNPVLIDFSLAKFVEQKLTAPKSTTSDRKHTGDCGTATYMAPEVYAKEPYGIKAGRCLQSHHPNLVCSHHPNPVRSQHLNRACIMHPWSSALLSILVDITSSPTNALLAMAMASNTCTPNPSKILLGDDVTDHKLVLICACSGTRFHFLHHACALSCSVMLKLHGMYV